jgi:hypothetical protein
LTSEVRVITDHLKAKVLASVAGGLSISEAAARHSIDVGQARNGVARICRDSKLPSEVSKIHANPAPYKKAAERVINTPRYGLRKALRKDMEYQLRLQSPDQIEPGYISNLTAAMILDAGITDVGLAEIQEWMAGYGASLKKKAPVDNEHVVLVKRAMYVLDSFGVDVEDAKRQIESFKA